MRERAWQQIILTAAGYLGYSCYHTYDSRRSTPGFPDLVCAKPGRVVVIECKTEKGKVRPEQEYWLALFGSVPGVTAMLARPSDWDAVEAALRGDGDE